VFIHEYAPSVNRGFRLQAPAIRGQLEERVGAIALVHIEVRGNARQLSRLEKNIPRPVAANRAAAATLLIARVIFVSLFHAIHVHSYRRITDTPSTPA